ncbi:hypothetical protein EMIHUDRAFT_468479, partial [Emiliania huxleyi CCMP1516]|uniref:tRNA-uridine aminocarboxypropyltransferase n=2 Tax=Emiliania huxleyi TaxID=2903 RepID=A0A0D3K272_EMIH1
MHHKEFLSAGDDAKLLTAMLPPEQARVFVYGRRADWDALAAELAADPQHTMLLWPGEGALTVGEFVERRLPQSSPWRRVAAGGRGEAEGEAEASRPLMRVVVLDGVYNHARSMFRALRRRLPPAHVPPHVALHPTSLSVYQRAAKRYASASAATVAAGATGDAEALRVCTVEAAALLLQEVGEPEATTHAFIAAVVANNGALQAHKHDERREANLRRRE